jgi:hypothetical protein
LHFAFNLKAQNRLRSAQIAALEHSAILKLERIRSRGAGNQ